MQSEGLVDDKKDVQESDIINEEDWSDEEGGKISIQLGFVEAAEDTSKLLFRDADWRNWDGGKIGGWPIWLDPEHIPLANSLLCQQCNEPLCFLTQMYCPIDGNDLTFHRALYVFCCRKSQCSEKEGSVKCFRAQLTRSNKYYCYEPKDLADFTPNPLVSLPPLCAICGCRGHSLCSACKKVSYCHKSHQKMHWKKHKSSCFPAPTCAPVSAVTNEPNSFCFEELEMFVELEQDGSDDKKESQEQEGNIGEPPIASSTHIWEDAETKGDKEEEADDIKLGQGDYNKALSEQKYDKVYVDFLTRMDLTGNRQVLRYVSDSVHREKKQIKAAVELSVRDRDRGRLFISERYKSQHGTLFVPPCSHCQSPRALECQIMPQLLYYLKVDRDTNIVKEESTIPPSASDPSPVESKVTIKTVNKNNKDMSWGTVDVYTCSSNCSAEGYLEEYAAIQALSLET